MDIVGLIPAFGGAAYTLIAFVIALSIIVAIHEYGHYIVGRWCGIHAEVFSLGMGPVLWSRVDKRGTKWQIAALPFGGYVKFLGDANAASGKDVDAIAAMDASERRHTMHSAPLWARSSTVAAGPVFNFVLSFLIFAAVLFVQGETKAPLTVDKLRPVANDFTGLEVGDQILAINGQTVDTLETFGSVMAGLTPEHMVGYTVLRGGDEMYVAGPWPYPAHVVGLSPQSAAFDINMRVGDVITSVGNKPIFAFSQLKDIVENSDGKPLELKVWRDGETLDFVLVPRRVDEPLPEGGFATNWRIGIAGGLIFEPATETPGIGTALSYGVTQTIFIVQSSLSGLWNMITGAISSCNLSGPIGIAQTSGAMASQGATSFIWFIAVLSTAVGLLNLFPIPILDGGHLVFHAYEAVTGRPPSDRALRILMSVGLTLILSLMIFAVTNDLFCP